jgi:hypothetical protein
LTNPASTQAKTMAPMNAENPLLFLDAVAGPENLLFGALDTQIARLRTILLSCVRHGTELVSIGNPYDGPNAAAIRNR